jgi:SAM-dependent methyltransferase
VADGGLSPDPDLARAFGAVASSYERGRPGYPPEAIALLERELGIGPGMTVLDLAAGTGQLTRSLVTTGADVIAVEPLAPMRAELEAALPTVRCLDGAAEDLPLPDASVDAVTVAQAFHWFDVDRAAAEITRVLRPGGGLAVLFNERDSSEPWVAALSAVLHVDRGSPFPVGTDWRGVLADTGRFPPAERASFRFEQWLTADDLEHMVRSRSYVASMSEERRAPLLAEVRALVARFPEPFPMPYVCDVTWCRSPSTPS